MAHAACLTLLACGIVLRVWHFPVAVYTPDEDAYANFYAAPLVQQGLGRLPALVNDYDARPEMHQFPSPTRVGHLWLMVATMLVLEDHSPRAGAALSTVASVLILVLIWVVGATFVHPWVAAMALLFAIVSPMDLAMARRAWGDELFACLALAATWAFLVYSSAPRRKRWAAACLGLAGYAILTKETGLLLLGLATIGLTVVAWRASGPRTAALLLAGGAITLVLTGAVWAAAVGGWEPLRAAFDRLTDASSVNEYMRKYQSGGPEYYVRGIGRLQPLPMALGVLAAVLVVLRVHTRLGLPRKDADNATWATLAYLVMAFTTVAVAYPQKNLRFLGPAYAPLDLLAAGLLWGGLSFARARVRPVLYRRSAVALGLGLVACAVADHHRFVTYFIERQIPDLATPWFTR
ncbi:MAG TPA: glycosyltransferase family 39 protein [Candidatus Eisenbacteria bacterium]